MSELSEDLEFPVLIFCLNKISSYWEKLSRQEPLRYLIFNGLCMVYVGVVRQIK